MLNHPRIHSWIALDRAGESHQTTHAENAFRVRNYRKLAVELAEINQVPCSRASDTAAETIGGNLDGKTCH
jgi:hypothetical protein